MAVFVGALDQTVVAATLPALIADLGLPINRLDDVSWTITAYLAGYGLSLPLAGQLADRTRRVNIFVVGALAIFAVGSLVVGLGGSLGIIVAGRFVQAVGAGALLPVALGRVGGEQSLHGLARHVGWVTAIAEAGALLGPVYGALLVQLVGWRWVFLLNLPIVLALGWLFRQVPIQSSPPDQRPLDLAGGLLLGAVVSVATVAVSRQVASAQGGLARPGLLVVALALVAILVLVERRARSPVLGGSVLRQRPMAASMGMQLLGGASFMVALLLIPLWANTLLGRSATEGALLLARLTLVIPLGALAGGWLSRRFQPAAVAVLGLLIVALGGVLMAAWPAEVSDAGMTPALLVTGSGFGLMLTPSTTLALHAAGLTSAATAASLLQTARLVGMTLASAALASYGLDRFDALVADLPLSDPEGFTSGVREALHAVLTDLMRWGAIVALIGAAMGAVASWPRPSQGVPDTAPP